LGLKHFGPLYTSVPNPTGRVEECVWLFNLYMDHISGREVNLRYNGGVKLEGRIVQFLLLADDFMLVAETNEDVERN